MIHSLKSKKAPGFDDGIRLEETEEIGSEITLQITHLMYNIVQTRQVPKAFKRFTIIPNLKKEIQGKTNTI